jgi:hypothetical protein
VNSARNNKECGVPSKRFRSISPTGGKIEWQVRTAIRIRPGRSAGWAIEKAVKLIHKVLSEIWPVFS